MDVRQPPGSVQRAIVTLLEPYCPGVTPHLLLRALGRIAEGDGAEPEPLLDKHRAARRLGVSWQTVVRMLKSGELAGVKIKGEWRVRPGALRELIDRNTVMTEPGKEK